MDPETGSFILSLLAEHNVLRLATLRDDGYPQVTTVADANDGLTLYVRVAPDSQKVRNIRHGNKVSLTIDRDEEDWMTIKGLSIGATAEIATEPEEIKRAIELLLVKFPHIKAIPELAPEDHVLIKITPKVICVLDYSKSFDHQEPVDVQRLFE